jgi:hypothetical protein
MKFLLLPAGTQCIQLGAAVTGQVLLLQEQHELLASCHHVRAQQAGSNPPAYFITCPYTAFCTGCVLQKHAADGLAGQQASSSSSSSTHAQGRGPALPLWPFAGHPGCLGLAPAHLQAQPARKHNI